MLRIEAVSIPYGIHTTKQAELDEKYNQAFPSNSTSNNICTFTLIALLVVYDASTLSPYNFLDALLHGGGPCSHKQKIGQSLYSMQSDYAVHHFLCIHLFRYLPTSGLTFPSRMRPATLRSARRHTVLANMISGQSQEYTSSISTWPNASGNRIDLPTATMLVNIIHTLTGKAQMIGLPG